MEALLEVFTVAGYGSRELVGVCIDVVVVVVVDPEPKSLAGPILAVRILSRRDER